MDLDRIPDEYLICASYDADLQVCAILPLRDNIASFTSALALQAFHLQVALCMLSLMQAHLRLSQIAGAEGGKG